MVHMQSIRGSYWPFMSISGEPNVPVGKTSNRHSPAEDLEQTMDEEIERESERDLQQL